MSGAGARDDDGGARSEHSAAGVGREAARAPGEDRSRSVTPSAAPARILDDAAIAFANRLKKTLKHTEKWARKSGVTCYRVYDADLPDYAVAVDVYNGSGRDAGKRWAHIAEYAPPPEIDPSKALSRLDDVLAIAPEVLGVDERDVFLKVRERQRGTSQYTRFARHGAKGVVEEGGLTFEVNFSDYLDTGIFLDHRMTRGMVREMAEGQRFLNLFAYTGTASVYAAAGGAAETTTVDMSATYTEWAGRNLAANGFGLPAHRRVQADVMKWLEAARAGGERYDLIFCDPPTFSNSKRMADTWDVQRDHVYLITRIAYILEAGGTLVFSCNRRKFQMGVASLEAAGLTAENITGKTIPRDFERTPGVHECWLIRHADDAPTRRITECASEMRRRTDREERLMTATALPPYTVRRSAKARLVRLTVTPNDGLVVVVPERWSGDTDAIVAEKREWAETALARVAEKRALHAGGPDALLPDTVVLRAPQRGVAGGVPRDEGRGLQGAHRRRRDRGDRQHRRRRGVPRRRCRAGSTARRASSCCRCSRRSRPRWSCPTPAPACATCARAGGRARRGRRSRSTATSCSCREHLVRTLMLHELAHTLVMDHSAKFWDTLAVYDRRAQINRTELKRAGQYVPAVGGAVGARWACCATSGRWSSRRSRTSTPTTCLAERPRCRTSCCSRSRRCC